MDKIYSKVSWPAEYSDVVAEDMKRRCLIELIRKMPFEEAIKRFGIEKKEYTEYQTAVIELSIPKEP